MKLLKIIMLFLFTCPLCRGQVNLVKNPSFESHTLCPHGPDGIKDANFWSQIDTTPILFPLCSPEYCNACDTTNYVGAPNGYLYYHNPHTGKGMVQAELYFDNGYIEQYQRDYVQGRFYSNLIAGKTYCVTFYVTLEQYSQYAINHIGAYIDDGSIDTGQDSAGCASPQTAFVPQIVEDSIINDTLNWVKVQGNYTANGTERFITIGNFFDIHHTDTIKRSLTSWRWHSANDFAYYLIDDVSVIASDTHAFAGNDTIIAVGDSLYLGIDSNGEGMPCIWYTISDAGVVVIDSGGRIKVKPTTTTTYVVVMDLCGLVTRDTVVVAVWPVGVGRAWSGERRAAVRVFPNPASREVNIEGAENCSIVFYNVVGNAIKSHSILKDKEIIDITDLVKGVYFMEITDGETGERVVKRVVKE